MSTNISKWLHKMNKRERGGFTLVEVLVAVVVVGILASVITINFTSQQLSARDWSRSTKASIIANSLEKYYDKNGEYPSPRALASSYGGNTGDVVATLLSITDATVLVMPSADTGVTNSIALSLSDEDVLAYVAQSDTADEDCKTNISGGCDEFTLSYEKEVDQSIATIESTHKGRAVGYTTPLQAPSTPTITAVQSGTDIIATSSIPACSTGSGYSPRYSFRVQEGSGAWSNWSAWQQTVNTFTKSSNTNAVAYSFQVHVRCESSSNASETSTDSDSVSVTYYTPPSGPAAPNITLVLSGSDAVATSDTVTCDIGSPQYRIDRRTNDGAWTTGSWSVNPTSSVVANDGVKYGARVTAECVNGTQTTVGGTSNEVTYIDPIAAPGSPSTTLATYINKTWSWSAASCPSGTSPRYQYLFTTYSGSWIAGSWIETTGTSATNSAATSQGIMYGLYVQQQCYNSNASSGWGASSDAGNFWVPVVHAQLLLWAARLASNGSVWAVAEMKTFSMACASGLSREVLLYGSWNTPGANNWIADVNGWFASADGTVRTLWNAPVPSGQMIELNTNTRCRNVSTGYAQDASGLSHTNNTYDIGNLWNRGTKYQIECPPMDAGTHYCSGGYNSSGVLTNSALVACAIRSNAWISSTTQRYTANFNFGANTTCW